ncbi:MAG: xanthine dehydrogenase family protein subunit M, partial [Chloroflexi bacterium]|nr:xanthine dehydrogenase family protein subunit M [Chloroflexota bacterium]
MIPAAFDYVVAPSAEEAIGLLARYGDEAKILAGGHSLVPMMKLRLASPKVLIDIGRIPNLAYIREEGGQIAIGALTTHHMLETSALLRQRLTALAEAAATVGDAQVRSRGTLGGSVAHADPAADLPAPVLALEAEIVARGPSGQRSIRADEFFVDLFTTALDANELVTEVRFPVGARVGSSYQKFANKASHFAIVGVAAAVELAANGTCQRVVIGVTGAGPKAVRARAVEDALRGQVLSDDAVRAAADKAGDDVQPLGDLHGSAEYRLHLTQVLIRRAVR